MECGSYTRVKLLEHAMKIIERVFENRIWQQTKVNCMYMIVCISINQSCLLYVVWLYER